MKTHLFSFLFASILFISVSFGQSKSDTYLRFAFDMSEQEFQSIIDSRGVKVEAYPTASHLNGNSIEVERLRTRGKSTLHFPKKSFTVRLKKGSTIDLPGYSDQLSKKFYLMSLAMDLYHFHNRLAFLFMQELGIFPLYNTYAEVTINGKSQGIYLVLEHPEQYVLKKQKGEFLLRRGSEASVKDYETRKKLSAKETKAYLKQYERIQKVCRSKRGEALYQGLSELVDLEAYMKWLAFNYWVSNGDYQDEVFFYSLGKESQTVFSILPWDYDDIFAELPHEGWEHRNSVIGSAMIYSSEDLLGRTIAQDSYLYERYLSIFSEMLQQFDEKKLTQLFQQVGEELAPFMELASFQAVNPYDEQGRTRADIIRQTLVEKEAYMKEKRREYFSTLEQAAK